MLKELFKDTAIYRWFSHYNAKILLFGLLATSTSAILLELWVIIPFGTRAGMSRSFQIILALIYFIITFFLAIESARKVGGEEDVVRKALKEAALEEFRDHLKSMQNVVKRSEKREILAKMYNLVGDLPVNKHDWADEKIHELEKEFNI